MGIPAELSQVARTLTYTGSGSSAEVGIGTTVNISGGLEIKGIQVISPTGVWQGSSAGIQGAQGTTGIQGANGAQGTTGLQGTTGAQGTTGTQGIQGITGAQGTTGTQGIQGITGAQGTTGSQGITGSGTQGTTGAQGATGTQGTQGTFGPSTVPQNVQTSSYALAASDVGKHISITTGGVTVNSGIFSAGDAVSIYNNSAGNQTITQGSVTMYLAGTATTGNRTLAQRGVCTVLCVASNTFVIFGAGLS
jgi:hypothetical protein